jgi:hypothetical protein
MDDELVNVHIAKSKLLETINCLCRAQTFAEEFSRSGSEESAQDMVKALEQSDRNFQGLKLTLAAAIKEKTSEDLEVEAALNEDGSVEFS